jgi:fluoride exporter
VTWVAVALAGALGAMSRFLVDRGVSAASARVVPLGTLVVNVSGSLVAGVVAGLAATYALPAEVRTIVAGGYLGAYTTFSTAMYETARLIEEAVWRPAVVNLVLPLVLSVAAAGAGWWLVT